MNSRWREGFPQAVQTHVDQNPFSGANNNNSTFRTASGYNSNSQYYTYSAVESYSTTWGVGNPSNSFHGFQSSGYPLVETHSIIRSVGTSSVDNWDREHVRYASLEPQRSSRPVQNLPQSETDSPCSRYPPVEPQRSSSRTVKSSVPSFQPTSSSEELSSGSFSSEDSDTGSAKERWDDELRRKKNKLQEIEEQIVKLKASIGIKEKDTFVKPADTFHPSPSLRVRVKELLQQRHSPGFFSKADEMRSNTSNPRKESRHPLQLRVKTLIERKDKDPSAFLVYRREVTVDHKRRVFVSQDYDVSPSPPPPPASKSTSPPAESENTGSKGFDRFLNILNKGVDLDLLSWIVTDNKVEPPDSDEILSVRQPDAKDASPTDVRNDIQQVERDTEAESQRRKRYLHEDYREWSDGRKKRRSSGSRSKSPCSGKRREEEEKKEEEVVVVVRKVDEQQQQLQNVLRALGMSLEANELTRLSDRTQERLYGRKTQSRVEPERNATRVHREYSCSSSSSSSDASHSRLRSTSRNSSPSPQHGGDLEWRGRGRSPGQSMHGHKLGNESEAGEEAANYEPPYSHTQSYPSPHVAPLSGYTSSQHSQSYSTAHPPYCSDGFSPPFSQSTAPQRGSYGSNYARDVIYESAPDLAESEGQSSSPAYTRCLKTIATQPPPLHQNLIVVSDHTKKKRGSCDIETLKRKAEMPEEERLLYFQTNRSYNRMRNLCTEEEMNANLRRTLEAFNQKAKTNNHRRLPAAAPPPASDPDFLMDF